MYFVDTNIFLRFLTADDPVKATLCKQLFIKAQIGETTLYTSDLVIAELVWVLQSPQHYSLSRLEIKELLLPLLSLKNLILSHKEMYESVFELFCNTNVDYIDAYHAVVMKKLQINRIYSYDKHFDQLHDIVRITP
jgi:predicted nucleic acid-binding protein